MATSCHTHSLEPEGKNQRQLHGVFLVVAPIAWAVGQWLQAVPAPHDQLPGTGTRTLGGHRTSQRKGETQQSRVPSPFQSPGWGSRVQCGSSPAGPPSSLLEGKVGIVLQHISWEVPGGSKWFSKSLSKKGGF